MVSRRMFATGSLLKIMKALAIVGFVVGAIVFLLRPNESVAKTKKGPLVTSKVSFQSYFSIKTENTVAFKVKKIY